MALVFCYGAFVVLTLFWSVAPWAAVLGLVPVIAFHSSLQHEIIHGHPFRQPWLNALMVFPALGLAIPYLRFRDTHLAHHKDARLTDPYDDPETNFFDPEVWARLSRPARAALSVNNTLAGRMLLGPVIAQVIFMKTDYRLARAGDRRVILGWALHVPAVLVVLGWLSWVGMPVWIYAIAAYGAHSVLKIRTFLEHQAHERASARSVVIEDRGLLALLFLNNNLHVVHHMHPAVPWYRLPALYALNKGRYLGRNGGYRYRNYAQIFGLYFFRAKDPVPHPLWQRD